MTKEYEKIVVLSGNPGSLLGYAGMLNDFGYYSVNLCDYPTDLIALLEKGRHFQYLIVDAFDFNSNAPLLKDIAWYQAIASVILIADVNSIQRRIMFRWAIEQNIPLLGILQAPLRIVELKELIRGRTGADVSATSLRQANFG